MHAAFGANNTDDVPKQYRAMACIFVCLFDSRLLAKPVV